MGPDVVRCGHVPTVRPPAAGGSSAGSSPRGRVHSARVLAIGEFSRLTHLSVRTLRRYHDAGLLEPATVDSASGYRYYSADQIPTAQVIHRLRGLDVPLPDVQRILGSPDPGTRAALVADHLQRLESELDRTRAAVASLRRLLQPEAAAKWRGPRRRASGSCSRSASSRRPWRPPPASLHRRRRAP